MLHWFCFSYIGYSIDGNYCNSSTYTGYKDKKITIDRINENKKYAGVKQDAVLISCSYLGYMEKSKFSEKSDNYSLYFGDEKTNYVENENGLMPCPFCGEKDDLTIRTQIYNGTIPELFGHKYSYIECLPCDCRTGMCFENDAYIFGLKDGIEMAKSTWNKRK